MNNLPTKNENTILEDLFIAVYFNDIKKVVWFKNNYPEIYSKRNKFQIGFNTSFDLSYLTLFNKVIWFDNDWKEEVLPFIEKLKQRTQEMSDFWKEELGEPTLSYHFEYNQFYDYFYCNDPKNTEEVNLQPIANYLEKGFREIDLRLFNRALCFDFVEVNKLLELGAKFDIHFDNDNDSSTHSRIISESSYLATCHIIPEFEAFELNGYKQDFNIEEMFGHLIGLSAYEEMYSLLSKYSKST